MPDPVAVAGMRRDVRPGPGWREADLAADWLTQFDRWFADAVASGLPEPNAMVRRHRRRRTGRPSARTVLLKGYDERGFVFYTNYESRKGRELAANPYAAWSSPGSRCSGRWWSTARSRGSTAAETEAYFATRPRGSQLGAWASPQSAVVAVPGGARRRARRAASARFAGRHRGPAAAALGRAAGGAGDGGVLAGPAGRLHDRLRYRRTGDGGWVVERLAP